jgi:hypothetical protein
MRRVPQYGTRRVTGCRARLDPAHLAASSGQAQEPLHRILRNKG